MAALVQLPGAVPLGLWVGPRGGARGCQVAVPESSWWGPQVAGLGRPGLRLASGLKPSSMLRQGGSGRGCTGTHPARRGLKVQETGREETAGPLSGGWSVQVSTCGERGGSPRGSGKSRFVARAGGTSKDSTGRGREVSADEIADVSSPGKDEAANGAWGRVEGVAGDVDAHSSMQDARPARSDAAEDEDQNDVIFDVHDDVSNDVSASPRSDALAIQEDADYQPWRGAVLFRRSSAQSHYEFETTLERLALSKLASSESREVAASMGIIGRARAAAGARAGRSRERDGEVAPGGGTLAEVAQSLPGTPVGVSCDVERSGRDLKVDGIVRTAIMMKCRRCLDPVVERLFAGFSLVLTPTPVVEPTQKSVGVVLGTSNWVSEDNEDDGGGELDLDLDDRLYFPAEQREMDLSKYIRDVVHLEIPMGVVCRSSCRGLCLSCGVNLNQGNCRCKGSTRRTDPRWDGLEKLKGMMKDDGVEDGKDG